MSTMHNPLPAALDVRWRWWLRRLRRPAWLGLLRRLTPLSDSWGMDRGLPIDRYYIERFLAAHQPDIHGRVLEVKDATYTTRFGRGVQQSDVLDINADNPRATVVADLTAADNVEANTYDCCLVTQTLQFIYDTPAALRHLHRILRPGGVLLVTVPSVSRIAPRYGLTSDYWRFTVAGCEKQFGAVFGPEHTSVQSYGNVLTASAFLAGLAQQELSARELDAHDPYFPLIVAVRAVKHPGEAHDHA